MALARWMLLVWALGSAQAFAQPMVFQAGPIQVGNVHAAPTAPAASVGAVYLWITNHGTRADALIDVQSPVAASVEIHRSTTEQGMMQMRQLAVLECPAGATVKVEPGAVHLMLLGLKRPLAAGSTFPMSLHFRDAGILTVQVSVEALE